MSHRPGVLHVLRTAAFPLCFVKAKTVVQALQTGGCVLDTPGGMSSHYVIRGLCGDLADELGESTSIILNHKSSISQLTGSMIFREREDGAEAAQDMIKHQLVCSSDQTLRIQTKSFQVRYRKHFGTWFGDYRAAGLGSFCDATATPHPR